MQITKTVQLIGNGGHIYLPKEMVGQKVAVSIVAKSIAEIEKDIIQILQPYLKHIKGVYLCGSHARGEQTPESDIDVLVITDGKIDIKKRTNEYELVSVSLESLEKTIKNNAVLILPMVKEAIPILNEDLLDNYKKEKLTKKNTKWYIESTETSLKLAKNWLKDKELKSIHGIIYPLILRLRGLYSIDCLMNNKPYSNRNIDQLLIKRGLPAVKVKQINSIYRAHRGKKKIPPHEITYDDIDRLYNIAHQYYQKVKQLWGRLR